MRQFFIPSLIVFLLFGLFIPIPSSLIDYLVILNVLLGLLLLFCVLLIDQPTKLTTLPSFLLILTLFRLVTNISTTRQILSGVEPGKLIPLIGESMIQGSVLIGLVIFGILTLVQLIVVSKGAERVAEVSARFTLDALPGKQMSIDADVRAGLIDFNEARRKRQETQIESRFYGALDGSMKFIKGDAIVGILITFINLIGGFITGMLLQQLDLAQALKYYSLMTIGDGVVSQIPAILNSIAAGILVTRVVSSDSSNLATELIQQLFSNQGVKIIIILINIIFACLPGVPSFPFLIIGLVFFGLLFIKQEVRANLAASPKRDANFSLPILIRIIISKPILNSSLSSLAYKVKQLIYQETGLIIPLPTILYQEENFDYQLEVRGQIVATCQFNTETTESEVLILEIIKELNKYALDLLDDRVTRALIELWEESAPHQVNYLIPDQITVTRITTILKDLIREEVYPKNFDLVMQTIAENIEHKPNNSQLLNLIRQALRYQISARYLDRRELLAITLDSQIEQNFFKAVNNGVSFNLTYLELIETQIRQVIVSCPEIVVVCSASIRHFLWQCLVASSLSTKVLAYEEILPEIQIKSLSSVVLQNANSHLIDQQLQLV